MTENHIAALSARLKAACGLSLMVFKYQRDMTFEVILMDEKGETLVTKRFEWFATHDDVTNWVTAQTEQYASWK